MNKKKYLYHFKNFEVKQGIEKDRLSRRTLKMKLI
jgi:hypothetical protein